MYFRFINIHLPSNVGHHSLNIAKGPRTTTWIWNIHASTHDITLSVSSGVTASYTSKVLSSHSCHLSLTPSWLSSMHYHGAYYSNYHTWLKDSPLITPSSHLVWSLIGQESVNTLKCNTLGHEGIFTYLLCIRCVVSGVNSSTSFANNADSFYTGIQITTGLFHLWHSTDIYSTLHLQHTCMTSIITTITYTLSPTHPPNTHVILPPILTPTLHHLHPLTILGSSSIT